MALGLECTHTPTIREDWRREEIRERLARAGPSALAGIRVEKKDTQDGVRFVLDGGYWALARFSGTEPLLRVYAEAESQDRVKALLGEMRSLAGV